MLTTTDWRARVKISWDAAEQTNSTIAIDTLVPADPPIVPARKSVWRLLTRHPRIFGGSYQFNLVASKVNVALGEGRGRSITVRDVREERTKPPLAVAAWHLPRDLTEPLLITALAPRVYPDDDPGVHAVIDYAVVLLLDALLYVAVEHRAWALARLASARRERAKAKERLGALLVDVAHRNELRRYLTELLPGHVEVAARVPSGVARVRIKP